MSTIKANDLQNASGGIPTVKGQKLICTAWVRLNGTGTIAISDSENVSSITDLGTGYYRATFVTAMATTNYCSTVTTNSTMAREVTSASTADHIAVQSVYPTGFSNQKAALDVSSLCVHIFGGQ